MLSSLEHLNLNLIDDNKIAVLTISNGPFNVLSAKVAREIQTCFEYLIQHDSVRVAVVTGAGAKAFMAGADIKEFGTITAQDAYYHMQIFQDSFLAVEQAHFPVIAAVNGLALGGGCELAIACDIRIAAKSCRMGLPEVTLGIIPSAGGTQRLTRIIGAGLAKQMLYTGEALSAEEGYRIGLFNQVVDNDNVLDTAIAMAQRIAEMAPIAVAKIKKVLRDGEHLSVQEALLFETKAGAECFSSQDIREGIDAFVNKRPAVFTGR